MAIDDESFVLDDSVVMSWCLIDKADEYADNVLDRLMKASALVSSIWPLEMANVLLAAERHKRLGEVDSTRFITLLSQLPIVVEQNRSEDVAQLIALGRATGLSSYVASYLYLAVRKGIPLAMLAQKLPAAADKTNVALLEF